MSRILWVGVGGFIGSVARYVLGGVLAGETFPYATLAVNVIGCFAIGLLAQLIEDRGVFTGDTRAFLIVGILGGFTTFSAFGNETMNLVRAARPWLASANVAANVIAGLAAVWLGRVAALLVAK